MADCAGFENRWPKGPWVRILLPPPIESIPAWRAISPLLMHGVRRRTLRERCGNVLASEQANASISYGLTTGKFVAPRATMWPSSSAKLQHTAASGGTAQNRELIELRDRLVESLQRGDHL